MDALASLHGNETLLLADAGTLGNAAILRELRHLGFGGPVGVQGFSVNAPPEEALERSMRALRAEFVQPDP